MASELSETRDALVKVVRIDLRQGLLGLFKTVTLIEETGHWHTKLFCNVFSSHSVFNNLKKDMKLNIKVKRFSRKYHTLMEAVEEDFAECIRCNRFIAGGSSECLCPTTEEKKVRRIEGVHNLVRITKSVKIIHLYFEQNGALFSTCIFPGKEDGIDFIEGSLYNLIGWQNLENRHNVVNIVA